MRKLLMVGLCFLLTLLPAHSKSFLYRNKHFVLIAFNVTIHEYIKSCLDEHLELFAPTNKSEIDPIIASLKSRLWPHMEERIEKAVGVYILPINAYGSQFTYDVYGFPNITINRAIRRSTSKFYLRVDLSIDAQGLPDQRFSLRRIRNDNVSEDSKIEVKPQITLTLTAHNDQGVMPIDKVTATVTASKPCHFTPEYLDGFTKSPISQGGESLFRLIDMAINSIIEKMSN